MIYTNYKAAIRHRSQCEVHPEDNTKQNILYNILIYVQIIHIKYKNNIQGKKWYC